MFQWLLVLLAILTTPHLQAQKTSGQSFTVKGVLVDSLTQKGEPYATIRIFTPGNTQKAVYAAVTQNNGKFNEKLKAAGTYIIHFSSVGRNSVTRTFSVSDEHPIANLGTLLITESAEMLKGVEVVVQKPLVKAEIDKVIYSMEDDPDSKTNSTLEMLRKVPLVTLDGEDNIKVNGSGSFKVHVNGKPNSLMSNNPKEVLKSLPANSVKSIEVITEPGAKYDADGIGGILNIITVGRGMEGYIVSMDASVNNNGYNASGFGTVQLGKFTVTGNYSYNHTDNPTSFAYSEREDFTSENFKHLIQNSSHKGKSNSQYATMEGSYEADTLNLITFSVQLMDRNTQSNGLGSARMLNAQRNHAYSYDLVSRGQSDMEHFNATFDYQRSFKKKGEYLTFSYRYGTSPTQSESHTNYENIQDYPYDTSYLYNQFFNSQASTDEHILQLDYTNPINRTHSIDFGGKYIWRNNHSENMYMKQNLSGDFYEDNRPESEFKQTHNIVAGYFDYMVKTRKLSGKMGVRYEHTFDDVKYVNMPEGNYSAGFDNLVPSIRLGYQLAPTKMFSLAYHMRIARPNINLLNPFRDNSNPTSVSYGNPDLDPAKSHRLSINLQSFGTKFSTTFTLFYRFVNNSIQDYTFMQDGIQHRTYANIGHSQLTSLSMWMNWNPSNKTRITINASGSYMDYQSKSKQLDAKNHGFSGNIDVNLQQTLPWNLRLSLNGSYNSPEITLQGKGDSYAYYGASLSRSFLKNRRLTVALRANNMFNKYKTIESETRTSTFHNLSKSKSQQSYYGGSISWSFGELKSRVKKTAKTISGDDIMATDK